MAPVNPQLNNVQGMPTQTQSHASSVTVSPTSSHTLDTQSQGGSPSSQNETEDKNQESTLENTDEATEEETQDEGKNKATNTQDHIAEQVKNVLHDIFQVMTQISHYDASGRPSREPLVNDIQNLTESLKKVHTEAELLPPPPDPASSSTITPNTAPSGYIGIPLPLIQYVEDGRNPDIYTREFVELVRRMNQLAKGKVHAFRSFRDILAHEMNSALPELRDDVQRVLENTGGVHTAEFTLRPAGGQDQQGQQGQGQGQGQTGGGSAGDASKPHTQGQGGSMNMGGN